MARTRDESSPLFAGNAAGTLRLMVYLALAVVLMVLVLVCILPIQWLTRKGNDT